MKKLFLHIGAHKTGTTSLQKILDTNRDFYFEKYGVLFPDVCRFHFSQHRIAFSLKNMRDPGRGDFPVFKTEISELFNHVEEKASVQDVKSVVLSSEEFFTLDEESIRLLISELEGRGFDVNVCAFIRRQDSQFLSVYNQKVKSPDNGFFRPVSYFLNEPEKLDDELFFGKHLKKWKESLGRRGEVSVYLYEESSDTAKTLLEHFFEAEVEISKVDINKSFPLKALELVRHIKASSKDSSYISEISSQAASFFEKESFESLLSNDERARIIDYFEEDSRLIEKLVGREVPYFSKKFYASNPTSIKTWLSVSDVVGFFVKGREKGE